MATLPVFTYPKNSARTKLATPRTPGDATLTTVNAGAFGSPSVDEPIRVVVRGPSFYTIFLVTSIVDNVMTLSGSPLEGTVDHLYPEGVYVESDVTGGHMADAYDALRNLAQLAPTSASTLEFPSDGTIVETHASGLVVTTSFAADGTMTTVYGDPINLTKVAHFNADGSISESIS